MNFSEIVYLSLRMAILRVKATNTTEKEDEKRTKMKKGMNMQFVCY